MAHTSHGHHIAGTVMGNFPYRIARCGGVDLCNICKAESVSFAGAWTLPPQTEQVALTAPDNDGGRKVIGTADMNGDEIVRVTVTDPEMLKLFTPMVDRERAKT